MKPFCIYFPQFYPTEINNVTWGDGFTDWVLVAHANMRNVWKRRAPQIGYYDGANPQVHLKQIDQMKQSNLGGIALYHYWFYESRELTAFEQTISSTTHNKDFPWFLIWATESWSKRWIGDQTEIINLSDNPSFEQIHQHCEYLTKCFSIPTYFKIGDRPLFIFYDLTHFSNPKDVINKYKEAFKRHGHHPIIGQFVKNPFDANYSKFIDINYLFEPRLYFGFNNLTRSEFAKSIFDYIKLIFGRNLSQKLLVVSDKLKKKKNLYNSTDYIKYRASKKREGFVKSFVTPTQEVISPGWNNAPRYGNRFTALEDIEPHEFKKMLHQATKNNEQFPPLINAWNEWSEGAAIEPCKYYGSIYLECLHPTHYKDLN